MSRRSRLVAVAAGLVLAVFGASPSYATAIVEIVFPANGTNEITVMPGDPITAQIRLTADSAGISSYGISVAFDGRIQLVSATELTPPPYFNFTVGVETTQSDALTQGTVSNCEGATIGNGVVNGSFSICTLEFTAVSIGDSPILVGFFSQGLDGLFDNAGNDLASSAEFISGTVRVVPEPGTLLLLGAGAIGLAGMRKRG